METCLTLAKRSFLLSLRREFWQSSKIIVSTVLYGTSLATIFLCLSTSPLVSSRLYLVTRSTLLVTTGKWTSRGFVFFFFFSFSRESWEVCVFRRGFLVYEEEFASGQLSFSVGVHLQSSVSRSTSSSFYSSALRRYRAYVHICLVNWTNLVLEISLVVFGTASENS